MVPDQKFQIVLSTCADQAQADAIAHDLIQNRAAACVNIIPKVRSVYRWQGEVASDEEYLLVIKGTRANFPRIEQRIRALHSYELPEIVAVPIETGSGDYLDWIGEQVTESD